MLSSQTASLCLKMRNNCLEAGFMAGNVFDIVVQEYIPETNPKPSLVLLTISSETVLTNWAENQRSSQSKSATLVKGAHCLMQDVKSDFSCPKLSLPSQPVLCQRWKKMLIRVWLTHLESLTPSTLMLRMKRAPFKRLFVPNRRLRWLNVLDKHSSNGCSPVRQTATFSQHL